MPDICQLSSKSLAVGESERELLLEGPWDASWFVGSSSNR